MGNTVQKYLSYMIQNEKKVSDSYYAYLLLFDANNKRERKELFNSIIKDPHSAYLFIKNCKPDSTELDTAFISILTDPQYSYMFLKECENIITSEQKEQIMRVILQDSHYSYLAVQHCRLSHDERKQIFDKWHDSYIAGELDKFLKYCQTFLEFIGEEELEILVNLIYEEQDLETAEKILQQFQLPDFLKDKLESMYLMDKINSF